MCCSSYSWCSEKGLNARKKGMKERESKPRQWAYCMFFTVSCLICLLLCAIHTERFLNAARMTLEFSGHQDSLLTPAYDSCKIPSFERGVRDDEFT